MGGRVLQKISQMGQDFLGQASVRPDGLLTGSKMLAAFTALPPYLLAENLLLQFCRRVDWRKTYVSAACISGKPSFFVRFKCCHQ